LYNVLGGLIACNSGRTGVRGQTLVQLERLSFCGVPGNAECAEVGPRARGVCYGV